MGIDILGIDILALPLIIILKSTKSTTKFYAIFFSKINPDAYVSTKTNTFTFYKWGSGGQ